MAEKSTIIDSIGARFNLHYLWQAVRKKHLFFELPAPELSHHTHPLVTVERNIIRISAPGLLSLSKRMPCEKAAEALLDHAVSHHLYCPWDFKTHLKLYAEAKKVIDDPFQARQVADAFMDVVADTRCVEQMATPLPELYRNLEAEGLDGVVRALYQRLWREDLNVCEHEDIAKQLAFIPYLDRKRWPKSLRRFATLLKPHLSRLVDPEEENMCGSPDRHAFSRYTVEEIEKGIAELAAEAETPKDFMDILEDCKEEIDSLIKEGGAGKGRGAGLHGSADVRFYMKLAENHRLPIRGLPVKTAGSLYPHHHTPWETGGPCRDIGPWTSFGKLMPGITKTWRRERGEVYGPRSVVPDAAIMIDSSSSMTNPQLRISFAVLGAGCAADAYLRSGCEVAVYNFSDAAAGSRITLPYGKSRQAVYEALCTYFGGGTRPGLSDIKRINRPGTPDIFLITDMQITNLEPLIEYFISCSNRITVVHIGENLQVDHFKSRTESHGHIRVFPVTSQEHIPKIILGQVDAYMKVGR
ncbi:MAG: hypothetical protein K9K62_12325 [Desulfobacteraceae bacterium]|nr:hypothetical protein [Desulfobacteraceae bacterium]